MFMVHNQKGCQYKYYNSLTYIMANKCSFAAKQMLII